MESVRRLIRKYVKAYQSVGDRFWRKAVAHTYSDTEHGFCKIFYTARMISTPGWHSLLMDRSDHADAARLTDHALCWTHH
jgi:hypothetical protein